MRCRGALAPYPSAFTRAINCTDILKHAGKEIFDSHRSRKGRHVDRSQGIVGALQHDDANAGDRELQAHRDAIVEQNGDATLYQ